MIWGIDFSVSGTLRFGKKKEGLTRKSLKWRRANVFITEALQRVEGTRGGVDGWRGDVQGKSRRKSSSSEPRPGSRIQNSQFRRGVCWKKHESNVNLASAPSTAHQIFSSLFLPRSCLPFLLLRSPFLSLSRFASFSVTVARRGPSALK